MDRLNISSGAPWEKTVGYSRAVRVGNTIEVAGTTSSVDGVVAGKDRPGEQTRIILEKIRTALQQAGSDLHDVVRTRMYVTDISRWEEVGKVHGEFFGTVLPATTLVEVRALIDPDMLVEIEATAIVTA